jgi:hypothetical protein
VSWRQGPEARHPVRRGVGRGALWLARNAAVVAVAVAVAPVTIVAVAAAGYAWWRGWTPRRLYMAALWCLPMAAAWLVAVVAWPQRAATAGAVPGHRLTLAGAGSGAATASGYRATLTGVGSGVRAASGSRTLSGGAGLGAGGRSGYQAPPPGVGPGALWFRVVAAPYRLWAGMWGLVGHGNVAGAVVAAAPLAIGVGVAVGGLGWAYRGLRMRSGAGGLTPAASAAFDQRQWRHQVRSARALIAAPGSLPLLSGDGRVAVGATIRAVGHRAGVAAAIPYERLRSHQVVIGSTGTGKTTLLLRLWAGFMAAGLRRHAAGTGRPPLLVVLDCKGGASSRKVADRTRRVLRDAGARSTAIWPDETPLSLWTLPPDRLVTTLLDLIEHGTGGAAYYSDAMCA